MNDLPELNWDDAQREDLQAMLELVNVVSSFRHGGDFLVRCQKAIDLATKLRRPIRHNEPYSLLTTLEYLKGK